MAGIDASNTCNRDVSMKANGVKAVLASMTRKDRALVARAEEAAIEKAKDLKAGVTAPFGFWDPWSLSTELSPGRLLFYREAEIKHGRVCMLASLGFVVGEQFHPLFGGNIDVPSYIAFQQTPLQEFWQIVAIVLTIIEFNYSVPAFNDPTDKDPKTGEFEAWTIKADRVPGDLGWDPLGLKPKDPKSLLDLQNKEILNGRLAMIATAGMVAQELVTGKKLF